MNLFLSAGVDGEVEIVLHTPRDPQHKPVSIMFDQEQVSLDFFDVESLERLRDLADQGARHLRAILETSVQTEHG